MFSVHPYYRRVRPGDSEDEQILNVSFYLVSWILKMCIRAGRAGEQNRARVRNDGACNQSYLLWAICEIARKFRLVFLSVTQRLKVILFQIN